MSAWRPEGEEVIRAELYGMEALEARARELASGCQGAPEDKSQGPLLQRLRRNGQTLARAHCRITEAAGRNETLTSDAEWLLDNFYIVKEVLREVRHDLPRGYYRELPKLATGPLSGYPRSYALALALIAHTDSSLDENHITRIVQAYQSVTPLTIGELWAIPTMLRLGLLENLRRLADQILNAWNERRRAEAWIAAVLRQASGGKALVLPDGRVRLTDAFVVRALQLLRDQGPPDALEPVQAYLARHGWNTGEVVRRENHHQATNQVSVGNCVTSLRLLAALDWSAFFERTNLVEPFLRRDPAGVYQQQDFATRDRYRQAVEKLARRSRFSEAEVARRVLELARQGQHEEGTPHGRRGHVGHYLIDRGMAALKAELGYHPPLGERLRESILRHPWVAYFGTIAALTSLLALLLVVWSQRAFGPVNPWMAVLVIAGALLPVSELAVGAANYLFTLLLPPRTLPKLDFKDGIPSDCATFVVMPSMLVRPQSATTLLERLEIHYLANPDPQLYFALLTDFGDAPAEHQPEDEGYVQSALDGVAALNRHYAGDGPARFFLFHRGRRWNPVEGCWMGWERKRGKLEEFNRLLRGDRLLSYQVWSTDPGQLPPIRYVITLDLDTQLPREAAHRLVGTIAHLLNQARFAPSQGRVIEGYGVLQPRISFHLMAAQRSRFTRIWAASAGVDPYSTAVSDVYQDLFGAGTFTGKGIYDVDAFEAATGKTFPDNHILSHDLIEGNYARCGLVTDIELFDDFPARYHTYARREHRWIRGDWQLLPWLGRSVPVPGLGSDRARRPNPLPALERWKVFDNLRRSLIAPALVLWLVLSWTVLPLPAGLSTGLALLVLALPLLLQVFGGLVHCVRSLSLIGLRDLLPSVGPTVSQVTLATIFLLHAAYYSVDAIVRTLVRLFLTRRHWLEWETAASAERRLGTDLKHFLRNMWPAPALAVGITLLVGAVHPGALTAAGFILGLWFVSPLVAFWVSQAPPSTVRPLDRAERRELGRIARTAWGFFETFVGEEDHWLPPDNFQEEPSRRVAHRTSPTNQGLLLLSTLAAHDLGYLGLGELLQRLERTFASLDQLERYRGHFYNWYDTLTLKPLQPTYVSTVDSGNLLACLLTLKQGLAEKAEEPILGPTVSSGLADTLAVVEDLLHGVSLPAKAEVTRSRQELQASLESLSGKLQQSPHNLPAWDQWLARMSAQAESFRVQVQHLAQLVPTVPKDIERWAERFVRQVQDRHAELRELAPWLGVWSDPLAEKCRAAVTQSVPDGARRWETAHRQLVQVFGLARFEKGKDALLSELADWEEHPALEESQVAWLRRVGAAVQTSSVDRLRADCGRLAERANDLGADMDFRFLYKSDRHLFSIGYNVPQARLDASCYDLLASEARLTSFLAIARGDVPRRHWFHLGRQLTRVGGQLCLLSWGGTMFEYLMPELFLWHFPGSLVEQSCRVAVARQMQYGRQRGVPWGISESAFSSQYTSFDYQYQSFGVPGRGLKRGLAQDLVVAPYATALALVVRPHEALRNLRRLATAGAAGRHGYYEAIDYTRSRLPEGRHALVVRCFMAHHQGMSLLALVNGLHDGPMPRRFYAEPMVRASELLLQERVPRTVNPVDTPAPDTASPPTDPERADPVSRRLTTPFTPGPRTHLLSNGTYRVMVTNAGAGFSACGNLDVTRWREDYTRDDAGQFCYVRDLRSGLLWSAGHQPVCREAEHYEVLYSADKAEIRRRDGSIVTHLEITVCPENCAEVRRITLLNQDSQPHDLELTSYAEVVLAPHAADLAHPAFGKLFLETEWVPAQEVLLCQRRPRSPGQEPLWALQSMMVDGPTVGAVEYETDRAQFLGRGRTPASPAALEPGRALSKTTGPVLDPIFSLRRRLRLAASASASVVLCTAVAKSRDAVLALASHYTDPQAILRVFDLAWAHSQIELNHLHLSGADAHLYQRLATHLVYAGPTLRAPASALTANRQGQPGLWRHGISGDRPILLAWVSDIEEMPLVRQLVTAHTYWRLKGLEVDLVILSDRPTSYLDELHEKLQEAVRASDAHALLDKPGGIFLRKADHLAEDDRLLLQAAARVVLFGYRGSLATQVDRLDQARPLPVPLTPRPQRRRKPQEPSGEPVRLPDGLLYANGLGGFTPGGHEYCILAYGTGAADPLPPAPWVNVVANPWCGCLVSERGLGCTWVENSQQSRLTPWSNDPVSDPPGQVVYLRDETTGEVWTPTPGPRGAAAPTLVRHGQGYSRFEHRSRGLAQELLVFVPAADPVQVISLKVRNADDRPSLLSATFYAEWVLGTVRDPAAMNVRTEIDGQTNALLAHNPFNQDFASQVAFAEVNLRPRTVTADRTEFLGRNGTLTAPAALGRVALSGRVGSALDPCAALQVKFELQPGEEKEVIFLLGAAVDVTAVRALVQRYKQPGQVRAAFEEVLRNWEHVLTAVQVQTPDPAMDLLLNRWLPYQVLSCRVWGRSAFYQSSGAYGFRDQLQDVMALVYGAPAEARAHLLRAASRQFQEGDVQHWWHPPTGRGVRTRISDDHLWLPFVTSHYVRTTGDVEILDEPVPYLHAPRLSEGQEDDFGVPAVANEVGPLYEHCVRALRNGLRFGAHGLPLMGTGDWNDGMNRVGREGKGVSIWNGWFLFTCLGRFAGLAEGRGDPWATTCRDEAERLRRAIEEHAWDGQWYRRAYFDDGTPLGSAQNDECQIDSVAQSWAVLSGAAAPQRAQQAMAAVDEQLVRPHERLILLLRPPFDKGTLQPGYIKGYVPGIRENGGQYTHAAAWVLQAVALLGQGTHAQQLWDLLNPIRRTDSLQGIVRYRVEPYVVAGDVYGAPPHTGRGGWTWYTGSAAWLYRVALETMLGFQLHGSRLVLAPCISRDWFRFVITYRYRSAVYMISVENPKRMEQGVRRVVVDGAQQEGNEILLDDDGRTHQVQVFLG
jgi:cyclic beta-1,2-glucan synthetase